MFVRALEALVGRDAVLPSQQAWSSYRRRQCQAVFDFHRSGTIAGAAQARCDIGLAWSRMRDLEELIETALHH
jgi:uncharacterized protein YecT (DUF1311 family)